MIRQVRKKNAYTRFFVKAKGQNQATTKHTHSFARSEASKQIPKPALVTICIRVFMKKNSKTKAREKGYGGKIDTYFIHAENV